MKKIVQKLLFIAIIVLQSVFTGSYVKAQDSLVKDIRSGTLGSDPTALIKFKDTLFCNAATSSFNSALVKSDGTAAGTVVVKDFFQGYSSNFCVVNNTLFFQGKDFNNGYELWKSDGTAAGTVMVKNIDGASTDSWPTSLMNIGGTLYFTARDASSNYKIFKSDGTSAGTVPVFTSIQATGLFDLNGTFYTTSYNASTGYELYKTDLTDAGTVLVADLNPGTGSGVPTSFIAMNDTLYFLANNGVTGHELWKSDGTPAGTMLLKDIYPGVTGSEPHELVAVGNKLFFVANDGVNGNELWVSDGTPAGTKLVKDIRPGTAHAMGVSDPGAPLTNINGTLYFTARDASNGRELWTSDGTDAGTRMVKDIAPGSSHSTPEHFAFSNGRLYFNASNQLWKSDGTEAGTRVVGTSYSPKNLYDVNGVLFFQAQASGSGTNNELWKYTLPAIPAAPTALTLSVLPMNEMKLDWAGYAFTTDGFIVERSTDGNNFFAIDSTLNFSLTYTDVTALASTMYYYRVAAYNDAGISAYSNVVSATTSVTSINDVTNLTGFSLYPNPASQQITVDVLDYNNATVEIFNVKGQLLQSTLLQSAKTTLHINELSKGLYIVKVTNVNGVFVKKITKE